MCQFCSTRKVVRANFAFMVQVNEGYFEAPDNGGEGKHRLHYLDYGAPDAPKTVFCVHGLTRNAADFDALAKAIAAQGFRVLSLSMAGRGKSQWLGEPSAYHYGTYMADCLAFLDNFHLRNVDWIGTSMGGIVGMMVAAQSPKRIGKLVLNDVGSLIPAEGLKHILNYVSESPKCFESEQAAQAQLKRNMASFGIERDENWQQIFASSIEPAPDGGFQLAYDPEIIALARMQTENFTKVEDVNLAALWEAVTCPVLIVRGEKSSLLLPETVKAMCAQKPKAHSIEVAGAGHAPALMRPSEVQPIVAWLTGAIGAAL